MDEIKEPLCSVCRTAVAAFDGFILFLFLVLFLFVLIVFLEKKDEFFNTAPDADDDIICSYQVSCSRAFSCVFLCAGHKRRVLCHNNGEQNASDEMRRDDYVCVITRGLNESSFFLFSSRG